MLPAPIPVFLTLGSNIEPEKHLPAAVTMLAEHFRIAAVSRVYRAAALDAAGEPTDKPDYLNAAVLIELADPLEPAALKLTVLRPIEAALGRVRSADKYAPRTIDLDIVLYGERVIDDPVNGITIPDPDSLTRAYIALPLADLAPGFVHPLSGETLAAVAEPLRGQPGITLHPLRLPGR